MAAGLKQKTNGCLVDVVTQMSECGCPECAGVFRILWDIIDFFEDNPVLVKTVLYLLRQLKDVGTKATPLE